MSLAVFLLAFGAAARITRFINADTLSQPARDWLAVKVGPEHWLYTLVTCAWCASIWVAAPIIVSAVLWGGTVWWTIVTGWLTLSWLYGLAATWLDPAGGE